MPLITLRDVTIGFRGPPLLDGVSCQIEAGQRIGLLGRNGSGKTTLMRLLRGEVEPDAGDIILSPGTRVAFLPQDVPTQLHGPVQDVVAQGWRPDSDDSEPHGEHQAERAWRQEQATRQILSRMNLPGEASFETLSSGMKRRVLLARSLVMNPDLLLLDEPTNHLDIEAIDWLEEFLQRWSGTLMFVTHDRMFLQHLAHRILEIDRGQLFDWSCDYPTFLARKEAALAAEEKQQALFDKRLAEEEAWIRQGIKARRTRNEGRVRALEQMRRVRSQRQDSPGKVRMAIQEGQRSGNLIVEAEGVSFAYGEQRLFREFSTLIMRGDKIGVLGPNGVGKTTLLRVLLGQLPPQQGRVRLGTNLQIAYFDQLREQLDPDKAAVDVVADGYDTVQVGGQAKHVVGYLREFLFTPERARTLVRHLSGGERNRLLLARLFAKPANVIVLDEPTNDLDSETLELLEERLIEFGGTVLVVSHDRQFLNNVVTSTIVFEEGLFREYVGGYDDWQRQHRERALQRPAPSIRAKRGSESRTSAEPVGGPERRRLSYKEQQELAGLPAAIEQLEQQIQALHERMAQPEFYQQAGPQIAAESARLQELDEQLIAAYERLETLDS